MDDITLQRVLAGINELTRWISGSAHMTNIENIEAIRDLAKEWVILQQGDKAKIDRLERLISALKDNIIEKQKVINRLLENQSSAKR